MTYSRPELSDPRFSNDSLHQLTVYSSSLEGRGDITIYLPPGAEGLGDVPLVLLLHGVYGSHWAWSVKGGAHVVAGRLIEAGRIPPVAIAMPSDGLAGEGSGYIASSRGNFEAWIVEDVAAAVRDAFACLSEAAPLFIAGLSMGGYGALRLGAKYAERFNGISGHSSVTNFDRLRDFVGEKGADPERTLDEDLSILHWVSRNRERLPPLRFDCGTEDDLIEDNRALHQRLEEMGVAHLYEEYPGGHSWDYWHRHLEETLVFFGGVLTGARQ